MGFISDGKPEKDISHKPKNVFRVFIPGGFTFAGDGASSPDKTINVIDVFNQAYSSVNVQAIFYRNIFQPVAKCYCLGVENIISKEGKTWKARFKRNFIHQ